MKNKVKQVIAGEPTVKVVGHLIHETCCACGLTHAIFYNIDVRRGKRVVIKTSYIDDYETDKQRKIMQKQKDLSSGGGVK